MPSLAGISYTVLPNSLHFNINRTGCKGQMKVHSAWSTRFALMQAFLGGPVYTSGGVLIGWTARQTFPDYPVMAVSAVDIAGFGVIDESSGTPVYPKAELTIDYEPPPEDDGGDEPDVTATEELTFGGEFILHAEGTWNWLSGVKADTPCMQQMSQLLPTIDHVFTRKNVMILPKTVLTAAIGKVNSAVFKGVPIGKMLFAGAHARREITASGERPYELTLTFKERTELWNAAYSPADKAWIELYAGGASTGIQPYYKSDFAGLLGEGVPL